MLHTNEILTQDQIAEFKDSFQVLDTNNDGKITTTELGTAMKLLGITPSEQELKEIIAAYDTDGNGIIAFDEFVGLMAKKMASASQDREHELKAAFKVFDKDGDGFVSEKELADVLKSLGMMLTEEELKDMVTEADYDHDGKISFAEFSKILSQ